jgi:prepilin signal peptidase PulO-like enzyme (type II secretory pathway)
LVPIFSWLFLRGKCGYCGKKISAHYLMLELITGILFLSTFFTWNFLESIPSTVDPSILIYNMDWKIFEIFIFYIVEFCFLIGIFFYDLMHREIPDKLSIPAIVIAIAGNLVLGLSTPLTMLVGGGAIFLFFTLRFLISRGKWIGGGDIRLGALMGVLLGWEFGLIALIAAYIFGSIVSVILLIQRKVTGKTAIPFGPFMVIGILIAIFFGDIILNWYLNILTY